MLTLDHLCFAADTARRPLPHLQAGLPLVLLISAAKSQAQVRLQSHPGIHPSYLALAIFNPRILV